MVTINILDTFKTIDLVENSVVENLLATHKTLVSDPVILLDFRGCIIDYDGTSKIIDRYLEELLNLGENKPKTLEIVYDYLIDKQSILNWLFAGSKILDLFFSKELNSDKIEANLIAFVRKNPGFTIRVCIIYEAVNEKYEYK